jgi:hypothetical protein
MSTDDEDDDLDTPLEPLDPEAPGLDEDTRRRRRALLKMQQASVEEIFQAAVRAGIYTEDGKLTPPYCGDEPSAHRPTD